MMSATRGRYVTQRENRRFNCPCPDCGNLFYYYPFEVSYDPGSRLPIYLLLCDTNLGQSGRPDISAVDYAEYQRVCKAYVYEHRSCKLGQTADEAYAKGSRKLVEKWFTSRETCRASQMARAAYDTIGSNPSKAIEQARAALAISQQCPDSYALLARLEAKNLQEALVFYELGATDYRKLLSTEGHAFAWPYLSMVTPMEGAMRCVVGTISTLCRLGRGREAYEKMMDLLTVTPPMREAPAEEIWTLAPEVILRAKGPAACMKWMDEHFCDSIFDHGAAALWWVATYALAWTATHLDAAFIWSSLCPCLNETHLRARESGSDDDTSDEEDRKKHDAASKSGGGVSGRSSNTKSRSGGSGAAGSSGTASSPSSGSCRVRSVLDKMKSGMALGLCCCWVPHMMDMLLEDMPVPRGPAPCMAGHVGSIAGQVLYVRHCADLWRNTPGVLEYVRRYRNTYEVFCIVHDARLGMEPRMQDLRRFLAPRKPTTGPAAAVSSSQTAPARSAGSGSSASSGRSLSSGSAGTGGSESGEVSAASCIFPNGVVFEDMGTWYGLVDLALSFSSYHMDMKDLTFGERDLEVLRMLLAAKCTLSAPATHNLPVLGMGLMSCPLMRVMHCGYGPEPMRLLLRAGADPMQVTTAGAIPLYYGAMQGMWREVQAVFSVRRKLGATLLPAFHTSVLFLRLMMHEPGDTPVIPPAPFPCSVFEMCFMSAVLSPCVPCMAKTVEGCVRCLRCKASSNLGDEAFYDGRGPHGPWVNFEKLTQVLVAYGMTSISEPVMSFLQRRISGVPPSYGQPRRALLDLAIQLQTERAKGATGEGAAPAAPASPELQRRANAKAANGKAGQAAANGKAEKVVANGKGGQEAANGNVKKPAANAKVEKDAANGKAQQQQQRTQPTQPNGKANSSSTSPGATSKGTPYTSAPAVYRPAAAQPPTQQKQQQQQKQQSTNSSSRSSDGDAPLQGAPGGSRSSSVAAPEVLGPSGYAAPAALHTQTRRKNKAQCLNCGAEKDSSSGIKLRKCSGCYTAKYCSRACQETHWPLHQPLCAGI